jgi:hypothetical protein
MASRPSGHRARRGFQHMKAPAQPSHHAAKPRREIGIGQRSARFGLDTSMRNELSTRGGFRTRSTSIHAIQKSLMKHPGVSRYRNNFRIIGPNAI